MSSKLAWSAVVGLVVVAAGGGVAVAAGADGTITGCMHKETGDLRVVAAATECRPSERALTWNQDGRQGPQGDPGPQGVPGETGATGERGPSNAWFQQALGTTTLPASSAGQHLVTVSLPAGNYLLTGATRVTAQGTGSTAECQLVSGPLAVPAGPNGSVRLSTAGDVDQVTVSGAVSLVEPVTVALACVRHGVDGVTADQASLQAVAVGALVMGTQEGSG